MKSVQWRYLIIAVFLIALVVWKRDSLGHLLSVKPSDSQQAKIGDPAYASDAQAITKSQREVVEVATSPQKTHPPERLKDFMLPSLTFQGESIEVVLRELIKQYREACEKTGETALDITYSLPEGEWLPLHLTLKGKSFTSAVAIVSALSGMTVHQAETHFSLEKNLTELPETLTRSFKVSPDFREKVKALYSGEDLDRTNMRDVIASIGLPLDSLTQVRYLPKTSTLILSSNQEADLSAFQSLIEVLNAETPRQFKVSSKVIELEPGVSLNLPESPTLSAETLERFLSEAAEQRGVDISSLPSVVMRLAEEETMRIMREHNISRPNGEVELQEVGVTLSLQAGLLGFGQEVGFDFRNTALDDGTTDPTVRTVSEIEDTAFTDHQETRLLTQSHPDGSTTLLLLTPTLIDASGKPIYEEVTGE